METCWSWIRRHFGSLLLKYFIDPTTHTHARTNTHPLHPLSFPLYSALSYHVITFPVWGRADSSYPKRIEDHTNGDTIDSDTDPSVEMRSQIGPRTAHEICAERPNLSRGNRREKVRCATFCTVSKLCSNCDWMGDCCWVFIFCIGLKPQH